MTEEVKEEELKDQKPPAAAPARPPQDKPVEASTCAPLAGGWALSGG